MGRGRPSVGRQINFRAPPDLEERLKDTGEALGLDISALVRLILTKHIHIYEAEAEAVRASRPAKPDPKPPKK